MAKETLKQQDKRNLDLQLDRELEGTFPASDPLTITRFPHKRRSPKPSIGSNSDDAPVRRSRNWTSTVCNDANVGAGTNPHLTKKS
jgi:hypothetical protein